MPATIYIDLHCIYNYLHCIYIVLGIISNIKPKCNWIKNLNVRLNTIKLLEENIGRTLFGINCSNIFLDLSPRVIEINTKINKWEKIFANDVTNKGLISKIYK